MTTLQDRLRSKHVWFKRKIVLCILSQDAADRIDQLEAQVAQYKADAERYLGLRRLLYSGTVDVGEAYVSMKVVGSFPDQIQFDGGIDAAIHKATP